MRGFFEIGIYRGKTPNNVAVAGSLVMWDRLVKSGDFK